MWSYFFLFSDRDSVLWKLVEQTLMSAGGAVLGSLLLFMNMFDVLLIGLCIAVIDASLIGVMSVWDVPIDAASFVCLAMAVGLRSVGMSQPRSEITDRCK